MGFSTKNLFDGEVYCVSVLQNGFFSCIHLPIEAGTDKPGNTKGGSITVLLTSCLTGLELAV